MWSTQGTIQPGGEYIVYGLDSDPKTAKVYSNAQTESVARGCRDTRTETNYSPGASRMFHRTRYGSDELPGMKAKVSCVRGTQEGNKKIIQALADSGASTSIISWDLVNEINMTIYE